MFRLVRDTCTDHRQDNGRQRQPYILGQYNLNFSTRETTSSKSSTLSHYNWLLTVTSCSNHIEAELFFSINCVVMIKEWTEIINPYHEWFLRSVRVALRYNIFNTEWTSILCICSISFLRILSILFWCSLCASSLSQAPNAATS